jgi:hypothetical protein
VVGLVADSGWSINRCSGGIRGSAEQLLQEQGELFMVQVSFMLTDQ